MRTASSEIHPRLTEREAGGPGLIALSVDHGNLIAAGKATAESAEGFKIKFLRLISVFSVVVLPGPLLVYRDVPPEDASASLKRSGFCAWRCAGCLEVPFVLSIASLPNRRIDVSFQHAQQARSLLAGANMITQFSRKGSRGKHYNIRTRQVRQMQWRYSVPDLLAYDTVLIASAISIA
jgi:hypothetical protein